MSLNYYRYILHKRDNLREWSEEMGKRASAYRQKIFAMTVSMTLLTSSVMPGTFVYAKENSTQGSETETTQEAGTQTEDEEKAQDTAVQSEDEEKAQDTAVQSEGVFSEGVCGENIGFKLTYDGTLTLSGSGPMKNFEYDWKNDHPICGWGEDISQIKKIVIEDGITSISQYSFYDCENLKEVNIPKSIKFIGKDAFHWCPNVEKVSIDDVKSWCQIDFENENSNPIQYCSDLYVAGKRTTEIKVPDGITEMKPYVFWRRGSTADDKMLITSIQLPDTVTKIGKNALTNNRLQSLEIPDGVTSIGAGALVENNFSAIKIPENVTEIGNGAFGGCSELTTIELPDSVKEIGTGLFNNCTKLTSVKLPQGIKSIKNGTFEKCTALTEFEIPANVESVGESAFKNCTNLKRVTLPNGLRTVEYGAFSGCTSLSEINIPDTVTNIEDSVFHDCTALAAIDIPNSVTNIGKNTFYNCSALAAVNIPNSVTDIGEYAFYNCSALATVNIPNSVTDIGEYTFSGCSALNQVSIPDNVKEIGKYAFSNCGKLESIVIPEKIQSIAEGTFKNCKSVKEIKISGNITTIGESAFNNCSSLTQIVIPASVTELENYAFQNCSVLETVKFEGDAPEIGENAFQGVTATCYYPAGNETYTAKITTADYGGNLKWTYEGEEEKDESKCGENLTWTLNDDGKLAISGSGAMYDYSVSDYKYAPWYEQRASIKSLEIDDNVTYIGNYVFYSCDQIAEEETKLPANLQSIGEGAFKSSSIKTVTIPEGVTSTGKEAFSQTKLTKVVLPSSLKELSKGMFENSRYLKDVTFSKGLQIIGNSAFSMCVCMNSVEIPEGVTSIGDGAFTSCGASKTFGSYYSCYNFKSVRLPSTLRYLGKSAFYNCHNLSSVNIPKGITEIKEYTFANCYQLSSITIPQRIKSIEDNAFGCNSSLKTITFSWNAPKIASKAFDGGRYPNQRDVTANCYYPSNNPDWTSSMFQNYGGKLTWIAKEMEKPSGEDGSDKENNKGDNTGDNKGDSTGDNKGDNTGGNTGSGSSETEDTDPLGFTAHSLTLDGEIGVNFYLELNDNIINDSTARMEMVVGGKNITIINVSDAVEEGTTSVTDSKGVSHDCYKFTCKVNAKQMTDTITATLKTSSGAWKEYYSVQRYANEANNGSNESLKNIVNAMLTYGAYAQKLFGYNTSNLAGGSLKDVSFVRNENLTKYQYQRSNSEDNLSLYGASLLLKEKTTIRVYYQLNSGNITDYEFKVDGQSVTPKKSGDDLYYIEAQDIAAQDLDQVHTFQGGSITVSNYSALSYVKTVLGYEKSTEDNKNAMSALYLYWDAAEKYFK